MLKSVAEFCLFSWELMIECQRCTVAISHKEKKIGMEHEAGYLENMFVKLY